MVPAQDKEGEGSQLGGETDMFNAILGEVQAEGFGVEEIVTDKDNSAKSQHFPGLITSDSSICNFHATSSRLFVVHPSWQCTTLKW